jgi:hypothetical protein
MQTHHHLVVELHAWITEGPLALGCGLSIVYLVRFYHPLGHYPGAAPNLSAGRGSTSFRKFPQFDGVAAILSRGNKRRPRYLFTTRARLLRPFHDPLKITNLG